MLDGEVTKYQNVSDARTRKKREFGPPPKSEEPVQERYQILLVNKSHTERSQ